MLIRDPIHGDVALGSIEAAVLDLPEVQRLRGIKQLGTASYVYPGALHTRFDHSLGASAAAKRIVAGLRGKGAAVDEQLLTLIGIGSLLHDVTHVPFGHTLEDERRLFARHDKGERLARLLAGHLGEQLAKLGVRQPVAAILGEDEPGDVPLWVKQIVSSTIDADLLDYLRRDSYFTGLAQRYDDRIFHYFTIADGALALNMTKHGMARPDAMSEIIQILRMRYFLTERVYYHHTKVAAGAMISKAVELAQEHGRLDEAELQPLNDGQLFERLRTIPRADAADPRLQSLVARLEARVLFKRGYVLSAQSVPLPARRELVARYHEQRAQRHAAEQALAELIGCTAAEVIVYCPALTMMKEAAALVLAPQGLVALNCLDSSGEIRALEVRYEQLWRFYVFVPEAYAQRCAAAGLEMFGFASEHF